jgi:signal transduction histidine kinase
MAASQENIYPIVLLITILTVALATALINVILFNRGSRLRHRSQILELQAKTENEIALARNEVTEQTMSDVALELHDNLGQILLLGMIDLNQVDETNISKALPKVEDGKKNIQLAIDELRNISKMLSTEQVLKTGLKENIERLFVRINRSEVLNAELTWDFAGEQLFDSDSELLIFRIIQELVNNSLKHSRARLIKLHFQIIADAVQIDYTDNGRGVRDNLFEKVNSGQGVDHMKKRVGLVKGSISQIKDVEIGLHIRINIPYQSI